MSSRYWLAVVDALRLVVAVCGVGRRRRWMQDMSWRNRHGIIDARDVTILSGYFVWPLVQGLLSGHDGLDCSGQGLLVLELVSKRLNDVRNPKD
jgi:hypothetical protein